ncbi:MAG: type II secretion system F family protein [Pirellulaceae bacterium]|nr:type II secretion system F family protein [Pirellulaceae bacterium]
MFVRSLLAIALMLSTITLAIWLVKTWMIRTQVRDRWSRLGKAQVAADERFGKRNWLAEWLFLAGYRQASASSVFVFSTLLFGLLGLGMALWFQFSGLQALMEQTVILVPGGVGDTFLPVIWVAPWLIAIIMVCIPWLVVRKSRRERVELIEQDLPLALELFATLSEAGLGFDSALTRILNTRLSGRPLAAELRTYQSDLFAGRARVECLRRLSARMRISSTSIFVSAMVQAEQLGMGVARILRQQADDLRARRRERAIAFANALPVKRMFPLVICFLPGLFVWTLGPAFVQLFKLTETFTRGAGF